MTRRWTALILAGSRGAADPVAEAAGVPVKALAPLAGKPMISHVIAALEACPMIDRMAVSIEADAPALPTDMTRLAAASTPATSVLAAMEKLPTPLVVTTADNPLMTANMVTDFLEAATASGADIAAGLCPRGVVEQAGNPGRRTYLKLRDGSYSGCNLFALATPEAASAVRFWQRLEAERKRPWRMALQIGVLPLALYLAGQLSRRGVAAALQRRTGGRAELIDIPHPMAAHDVDKPSDLDFAERVLSGN